MPEITAIEPQKKAGSEFEKLLGKALRFLSHRPRSEREVRDRLWKKVPPVPQSPNSTEPDSFPRRNILIGEVISKLKDMDYVDDEAFVSWWLEQRIRFKPRGKALLRSELYGKGISRDLIEAELSRYSIEDEVSWAAGLVKKRFLRYVGLEQRDRREKFISYLSRRGFSWEVIERVLT